MTRASRPETINTCACGAWYGDDNDGREAHKKVFGHYPFAGPQKTAEDAPESNPEGE